MQITDSMIFKKAAVIVWLTFLLAIAGGLFWFNDWIYQMPTPIPSNYKPVGPGSLVKIDIPFANEGKPVFLHFFNPDCPCSRFNIANFKKLYGTYGSQLNFVIVVLSNKTYSVKDIKKKFDLDIPVLFNQSIATACGVYSTPQVALLDSRHKLYYRGNYNKGRYCTNEKTNYAKIAINGLLKNNARLAFNEFALRSYGCQLPGCTK